MWTKEWTRSAMFDSARNWLDFEWSVPGWGKDYQGGVSWDAYASWACLTETNPQRCNRWQLDTRQRKYTTTQLSHWYQHGLFVRSGYMHLQCSKSMTRCPTTDAPGKDYFLHQWLTSTKISITPQRPQLKQRYCVEDNWGNGRIDWCVLNSRCLHFPFLLHHISEFCWRLTQFPSISSELCSAQEGVQNRDSVIGAQHSKSLIGNVEELAFDCLR